MAATLRWIETARNTPIHQPGQRTNCEGRTRYRTHPLSSEIAKNCRRIDVDYNDPYTRWNTGRVRAPRDDAVMTPRLALYAFRYRDPRTRKWTTARYRAERHEIAARYAEWEIIGARAEERSARG